MRGVTRSVRLGLGLALLAFVGAGCERLDQKAHTTGEAARSGAARACASSGPDDIEVCLRERCAEPCGQFKATPTFERDCIATCVARGECATDVDCGSGLRCVAIAPRVRRCEPTWGADAGP